MHQTVHDDNAKNQINDRHRDNVEQLCRVDRLEHNVRHGFALAVGHDLRKRTHDQLHGKRDNKREHLEFCDQKPADKAGDRGNAQAKSNRFKNAHALIHHRPAGYAAYQR